MTMIDIVTFPLLQPTLHPEDHTTGIGRIWYSLLQEVVRTQGVVSTFRGRIEPDGCVLVLLILWKDGKSRDAFHRNGLGVTAMNNCLAQVTGIRYISNLDNETSAVLQDQFRGLAILSAPENWDDEEFERHKRLLKKSYSYLLNGRVHRLAVSANDSAVNHVFEPRTVVAATPGTPGLLSSDAWVEPSGFKEYCQIATIEPVVFRLPQNSPPSLTFQYISDMFIRDMRPFGRPLRGQRSLTPEIDGPSLSWRSPMQKFQYGDLCFLHRHAADRPTIRFSHLHPHNSEADYLETVSLYFHDPAPKSNDNMSAAGESLYAYRKLLSSQDGCKEVWIVTSYSDRRNMKLLTVWSSFHEAHVFHTAKATKVIRESLTQYLASASFPQTSPGVPFHPKCDAAWVEILDFEISPSALSGDRRAFEYYIWSFSTTMTSADSSAGNNNGNTDVEPHHEGWITTTDPKATTITKTTITSANDDDGSQAGDTGSTKNTYRVVYYWTDREVEAAWTRRFVETDYALTGHRAHWVALAAERVRGEHVAIMRDRLRVEADLASRGGDGEGAIRWEEEEEEEEGDNLGF